MKGSPLLRAALAFLLIAAAGIPLWRLTRAGAAVQAPTIAAARRVTLPIDLTFSHPPTRVAILHLGQTIFSQESPGGEIAPALELEYPPEGVDLQFAVNWPADAARAALRVRLTDPQGEEHERTVWGRGEMLETLTFP